MVLIPIVPLYLILYLAFNLYTSKRLQGRRLEGSNIIKANTIGLLLIMGTFFLLRSYNDYADYYSKTMLIYFLCDQYRAGDRRAQPDPRRTSEDAEKRF